MIIKLIRDYEIVVDSNDNYIPRKDLHTFNKKGERQYKRFNYYARSLGSAITKVIKLIMEEDYSANEVIELKEYIDRFESLSNELKEVEK